MNIGKIVSVAGPVVDVAFESTDQLPNIRDALTVQNNDKTCVMEVAQDRTVSIHI